MRAESRAALWNAVQALERRKTLIREDATRQALLVDEAIVLLQKIRGAEQHANGGGNGAIKPPVASTNGERWLKTRDVARKLGVTEHAVANWVKRGQLRSKRVPGQGHGGYVRSYAQSDVEKFAASREG